MSSVQYNIRIKEIKIPTYRKFNSFITILRHNVILCMY